MERLLAKKALPTWAEHLEAYGIYAPVKVGGKWRFEAVEQAADIRLDHLNTILSPKKIVFPQREIFFRFESMETGFRVEEQLPAKKPTVIFGVRPCDAAALVLMDLVFDGDYEDPYYWSRRNQITLVGLACNTPPSDHCFCTSVAGSPYQTQGLDVLMTDLGDRYFVEFLTEKGERILEPADHLFEAPTAADKREKDTLFAEADTKIKRNVELLKKVPHKLKDMFKSTFWEDESLGCIRCGICTYLCPTCHCFDINDEVLSTSPLKGERVRTWDNCQFPDFTMHSSGHNPRPDKASRLRQRILHKYLYFVEQHEQFLCTGCGRCVTNCPVGIDIIDVIEKVRDYGE